MSARKTLYIDEVLNAVKVDMDETGTSAAAATSVKITRSTRRFQTCFLLALSRAFSVIWIHYKY